MNFKRVTRLALIGAIMLAFSYSLQALLTLFYVTAINHFGSKIYEIINLILILSRAFASLLFCAFFIKHLNNQD